MVACLCSADYFKIAASFAWLGAIVKRRLKIELKSKVVVKDLVKSMESVTLLV